MENLYIICKGLIDPVFIIFVLMIIALITSFTGNKKKNGVLILGLAVLFLYGLSIAPVANYLAYSLEKDYFRVQTIKKPFDVIIVLGRGINYVNALNSSFASEGTAARLLHGVEILNKYGSNYFVCAGKGDSRMSEGEMMAQMALTLKVPNEKILIDTKSANTWEHAVELNKMFVNKNIYVGIVTSGYHMKRAEKEFKKYFNNVVPLPASYLYSQQNKKNFLKYIPQTTTLNITSNALKEYTGSIWYGFKTYKNKIKT
ncbi:MAG: YdcF family protein [Smithella sp.]